MKTKTSKTSTKTTKATKTNKTMKTVSKKTGSKRGRPVGSKNKVKSTAKKPEQIQASGETSVMDSMVAVSAPAERPRSLIEKASSSKAN